MTTSLLFAASLEPSDDMSWPTRKQYVAAIQRAQQSFRAPELASATFETDLLGMPLVSSGQTALVFKAFIGGEARAVRVFTGDARDGRDRYQELANHLRRSSVPSIADAVWHERSIEVLGELHPVVTMEWVEGHNLNMAVENRLRDSSRLKHLALVWRYQMQELRTARIAHGDLQHGNVIVDPTEKFRFIDLDGVWVPTMAGRPPSEFGQPNYQHPDRDDGRVWGEHIDWFSALVVYSSLLALASDSSLWRHNHGDNLIFRDSDFRGDSEIWHDLAGSPDPDVVRCAELLASLCAASPLQETDLESILSGNTKPLQTTTNATTGAGPQRLPRNQPPSQRDHISAEQGPESADTPWWASASTNQAAESPKPPIRPKQRENHTHQNTKVPAPPQRPSRAVHEVRANWSSPASGQAPSNADPTIHGTGLGNTFGQSGLPPPAFGAIPNNPPRPPDPETGARRQSGALAKRAALSVLIMGVVSFVSTGAPGTLGVALMIASVLFLVAALQSSGRP